MNLIGRLSLVVSYSIQNQRVCDSRDFAWKFCKVFCGVKYGR